MVVEMLTVNAGTPWKVVFCTGDTWKVLPEKALTALATPPSLAISWICENVKAKLFFGLSVGERVTLPPWTTTARLSLEKVCALMAVTIISINTVSENSCFIFFFFFLRLCSVCVYVSVS